MARKRRAKRDFIMRTCEACCREYRAWYEGDDDDDKRRTSQYSRTCEFCGCLNGRELTLSWEQLQAAGREQANWWDADPDMLDAIGDDDDEDDLRSRLGRL
jgi:hypothetical protein